MLKKLMLVAATAGLAATLSVPAQAQALCIYTVGFGHLPNAWVQVNPPTVSVDDGDPYVKQVCA